MDPVSFLQLITSHADPTISIAGVLATAVIYYFKEVRPYRDSGEEEPEPSPEPEQKSPEKKKSGFEMQANGRPERASSESIADRAQKKYDDIDQELADLQARAATLGDAVSAFESGVRTQLTKVTVSEPHSEPTPVSFHRDMTVPIFRNRDEYQIVFMAETKIDLPATDANRRLLETTYGECVDTVRTLLDSYIDDLSVARLMHHMTLDVGNPYWRIVDIKSIGVYVYDFWSLFASSRHLKTLYEWVPEKPPENYAGSTSAWIDWRYESRKVCLDRDDPLPIGTH